MMKVLSLCFLFASLVSAGILSPTSEKHNSRDDVMVKEGHKGFVIELEKDDGNTKVLITPQDTETDARGVDEKLYVTNAKEKLSGKMEKAKRKIKEASSSLLPEVGKEGDSAHQEQEENHHQFRPRELVCDAYGKCKHKIASYMGKTKEAVAETAHEAVEKVYEVEEGAKEAVSEAIGKVQDEVTHTAHMASDKAREMKESAKEAASEKATEKASEMKQGTKQVIDDAIHTTKQVKEEGERKMREKARGAEELAESASDRAKQGAQGMKEEGKKELRGILRRVGRVFSYMVSPLRVASVAGVLHLLGFATAYGMSVWVTFASSYVLAGILPRHQFAMVQSKIYPLYFKAMASGVAMALVGHSMGRGRWFSPLSLMASLGMILVNMHYLEPRATKVMFERMKEEKEEGRGKERHATEARGGGLDSSTTETAAGRGTAAMGIAEEATQEKEKATAKPQLARSRDTLRRLNSYSSLLNVATLMSLTWHLVRLGQHIYSVC